MEVIKTKAQFEKIYPYKEEIPDESYPKSYPCLCDVVEEDGGIGGPYKRVRIVCVPKWCDLNSFRAGLRAAMKLNDE